MKRLSVVAASVALAATTFIAPRSANAASTFKDIVNGTIVPLGDQVVRLIFLLGFFVFLFGVFRYFFTQGNEEMRTKGKQYMFWGVIVLGVMFVVWGIVHVFLGVLQSWSA